MTLSRTAAMREARASVTPIMRRSPTDYIYYAPWRYCEPHGASTEVQANNYWMARAMRSRSVASVALALMGIPAGDVSAEVHAASHAARRTGADDIVRWVLARRA